MVWPVAVRRDTLLLRMGIEFFGDICVMYKGKIRARTKSINIVSVWEWWVVEDKSQIMLLYAKKNKVPLELAIVCERWCRLSCMYNRGSGWVLDSWEYMHHGSTALCLDPPAMKILPKFSTNVRSWRRTKAHMCHFTPLVYSVDGLSGPETRQAGKQVASAFTGKWHREYSEIAVFLF